MPSVFAFEDVTVTRGTGDEHTHPLSNVRLTLADGGCTVVVGPSGAGKSTLLRLLNRLEEPSAGRLLFHGRPITSYDVLELRRRVGLVQQVPVLLTDRVIDDLRVAVPTLSEPACLELLQQVALGPEFLLRDTRGLSTGEGQRVCLARALGPSPEVLLLDEPTSALDAFAGHAVETVLRGLLRQGLTLVMVSHDLRQARRLADDVVVLTSGTVVDAGPADRVFDEPATNAARRFLAGVS